jgi:hypothetical protein
MIKETVPQIVRRGEENYQIGQTQLGEFVSFSHRDTVERIIAYSNSKHTTGDKDSLGRDKPFFNIITAAVNIWYRATDLDRKDVIIRPTKNSDTIACFFATVKLQEWMNKSKFGIFLNEWGRALAQYGSAIVKFVEKDGELIPSVIPWNRMITDAVDFEALPRIERIYKTPAQLLRMPEIDKDEAENLIESLVSRKNDKTTKKDNLAEFIELFEVTGELPVALLKDKPTDDDWNNYCWQKHIISFTKNKKTKTFDDFTLYKGRLKGDQYLLTHLIKEDGRVMSIGAVEYLFDAQWMQNHSMKNMKDTLDITSKLILQTADGSFLGRNALNAIETGEILIHKENMPLTQANLYKADITQLQNFAGQWKALAMEITSTPEAMRAITPPSGTPYSSVALLTQQAGSLFEIMTESKGLYLEEILRRFVIPYLKTKLNTKEEVMAVLKDSDIKKIDAMYIPNQAIRNYNQSAKEKILNGEIPEMFNKGIEEMKIKEGLAPMGNMRSFGPGDITWGKVFKNLEWDVEVGITNEPIDKQAVLQTLSTILQSIASNPNVLADPNMRLIFNKILSSTGIISPVELSSISAQPPMVPQGAGMALPGVESINK